MSQYPGLRGIPAPPSMDPPFPLKDLLSIGLSDPYAAFQQIMKHGALLKSPFAPPKVLPCAHVQVPKHFACDKPGSKICSGCRLVSYCSKECQQDHWKIHKAACKMELKSDGWKPAWRREGRPPMFMAEKDPAFGSLSADLERLALNGGSTLWGNMPAIDLVNLPANENDVNKDLSLAFIASGDLRNVIKTVNSLPDNFGGHLDILINDRDKYVAARNIVLLLFLGTLDDDDVAADVALHFWYSAFLPAEYHLKISSSIVPLLLHSGIRQANGSGFSSPFPLGIHSVLNTVLTGELKACFEHFITLASADDVQAEYNRVRQAFSRRDHRDRMFAQLKPSHRVAFHRFRHHGIVLPFGAPDAYFNTPNCSLFSFKGRWLQTDYADPLEGWNIDDVIQAGRAHGAQPEDIYGCLYFFLSDQLRLFARRIREWPMTFRVFCFDATDLSEIIGGKELSAMGLTKQTRFDRIEVSNILDPNYMGLKATLTRWAPFLSSQKHAVLVGCFMNWFLVQADGRVSGAGAQAMRRLSQKLGEKLKGSLKDAGVCSDLDKAEALVLGAMDDMDAFYENSEPFSLFLRKSGLNDVIRTTELVLRNTHRIVPHRLLVPLSAPATALPEFPDDNAWYNNTKLTHFTWVERYVEFGRS